MLVETENGIVEMTTEGEKKERMFRRAMQYLSFRNDEIAVFTCYDVNTVEEIISVVETQSIDRSESLWEYHITITKDGLHNVIFRYVDCFEFDHKLNAPSDDIDSVMGIWKEHCRHQAANCLNQRYTLVGLYWRALRLAIENAKREIESMRAEFGHNS
jgi:hypothetical protein